MMELEGLCNTKNRHPLMDAYFFLFFRGPDLPFNLESFLLLFELFLTGPGLTTLSPPV
jgi:hypothetical protein